MSVFPPRFSRVAFTRLSLVLLLAHHTPVFAADDSVEVAGVIATPGDYSAYSFNVSEESFFYFDALTNTDGLRWSLEGPAGGVVSDRSFTSSENSYAPFLRLYPGNHLLTVDSGGDATGDFAFQLSEISAAQLLTLGSPVNATLPESRGTVMYQFEVTAGDELLFDWISKVGGPNLQWRLVNPFGQEIFDGAFSADRGPYTLNNAGRHVLLIEGHISDDDAAEYAFQVNLLGNTPPPPYDGAPMVADAPVSGTIPDEGGQASHTFTVNEADYFTFDSLVDNRFTWTLIGPTGTVVSNRRFDLSDGAQISTPYFRLYPGDYQLTVTAPSGETGDYAFNLLSRAAAPLETVNAPITGTATPANAGRVYRLELPSGGRYYFDVTGSDGFTRPVYYRLVDPYGSQVFFSNFQDEGVLSLPRAGTYFLLIDGYHDDTAASGNFALTVHAMDDPSSAVTPGERVVGQIATPGQRVLHSLTLPADALFYFDSFTPANNPYWSLTSEEGTWKSSTRIDLSDGNQVNTPVVPVPAGDYTITIDGSGDFTGGFEFEVLDLLTTPPVFTPGDTVAGSVTSARGTAAYRFNGVEGQEFYFRALSRSGFSSAPYVRLVNPDGGIRFAGGWTDQDRFALTHTGTHILLVEGNVNDSGTTGEFEFNLIPINNGETAIATDVRVDGEIESIGQIQEFTFNIAQPDVLHFDGLADRRDIAWTLIGPTGTVVSGRRLDLSDAENYRHSYIPLAAGDHRLILDGVGTATGTFAFQLHLMSTAQVITPGDVISGTITPARGSRLFRFQNTGGDRFYFDVQQSQFGSTPYWQLRDPLGHDPFNTTFTDVNALTLPRDGEHLLILEGRNSDDSPSGQYAFEIIPVFDDQGVANTAGGVSGEIAAPGERDFYELTLASETQLAFDSLTDRNDIEWSLSGPTGNIVNGQRFGSSDAPNNRGVDVLPAGDYLLTVDGVGQSTGEYAFRLLDLADGTEITPDTIVNGSVTPARSMALHRFNAAAGDHFHFERLSSSSFGLTPYWKLIDPYGRTVFFTSSAEVANQRLDYAGTHTLITEGQINDTATTGAFSFRVNHLSNQPPPSVTGSPLTLGEVVEGTLANVGDEDVYTFTVATPRTLYFDSLANTGSTHWYLSGPRGAEVNNRNFSSSDLWLDLVAGDYTLRVVGVNDPPEDYAFRLLDANDADVFLADQQLDGALMPGNGAALYRFNGTAGQRFYVDYLGRSGFTYTIDWQLRDHYGNSLFSRSMNSDAGIVTLPFDGTYLLSVRGEVYEPAAEGTFSFRFNTVTDSETPVALDDVINGSIAHPGQVARYTFSLPSTTRVLVDLLANVSDTTWSMTGPDGTVVSPRNFSSAEFHQTLPAGDYVIEVDGKNDSTESYSFRVLNLDAAPVITYDTPVQNTVTPGQGAAAHRLVGVAGDVFYFDYLARSGFVYNPDLTLINPNGGALLSRNFNADAGMITIPDTGELVVLVQAQIYETAGSGSYEFNLVTVTDEEFPVAFGQTINGDIDHPGQVDRHTFSLATPTRVFVDLLENASSTRWSLEGPSGTVVSPRTFTSNELYLHLPAGDYALVVDGDGDTTNAYSLRVLNLDAAPVIALGEILNGTVSPGTGATAYQFDGTAGRRIYGDYLSRSGHVYNPEWQLISPGGSSLFNRNFNSDAGVVTLPEDGAYTLLMKGQYYETSAGGDFSLSLVPIEEENPTPILQPATDADLVVNDLQITPSAGLQSGDSVTVSWTIQNTGSAAAASTFHDRVTLRKNGAVVVNTTLPYDPAANGNGPIEASQSRARQVVVDLPEGPNGAGALELTVTTDTFNSISEQNAGGTAEANNAANLNFNPALAPYPDLQVGELTVEPDGGWSPGDLVTVTWRLDNTGDLATSGGWTDSVIVRNTATQATVSNQQAPFDEAEDGGPVAAGGSRVRQVTFTVPDNANAYGLFETTVTANQNQALFEHDPDTDATANNQLAVQTVSAADLRIVDVGVTGELRSGGLLNIAWETRNDGNADAGTFHDRVQVNNLTTGETLSDQSIHYNAGTVGNGLIEPGSTRARNATYRLPDGPRGAGDIEIVVSADRFNAIKEFVGTQPAEDNNTASVNFSSGLTDYPDLIVRNLAIDPATTESGGEITITWEDHNQGTGPASASWHDRITIVNTNTGLTVLNTLLYHNVAATEPLAAGASLPRQRVFRVPDGDPGTGSLRVTILADAANNLFEFHPSVDAENNNSAVTSVESSLAPYPDLLPVDLAVDPPALLSGGLLTLNWNTTNSGSRAVSDFFQERVVIRNLDTDQTLRTAVLNYDPTVPEDGPIEPGESRAREYAFQLPDGPDGSGEIEITVTTDHGDRVFEYNEEQGGETNNVAALAATATLAAYPDLRITGVTGPASALPGETIEVFWTVENIGSAAASGAWSDQVFLSGDDVPGGDTQLGTLNFSGSIGQGESLTLSREVVLPAFASGDHWLVVKANAGKAFYEPNHDNNTAVGNDPVNLPAKLTLTLSRTSLSETAGDNATTGRVSRNTDASAELTVMLVSGDSELVTVPDSVVIPAGETSASFPVGVINDFMVNGDRPVNLLAMSGGFVDAEQSLVVVDDDRALLTFQVSGGNLIEGAGEGTALGYLSRNANTNQTLEVRLSSSHPLHASMPETATFQPGEAATVISIGAPDNDVLDGTRTVILQADADGYNAVSREVQVSDNDLPVLSLTPQAESVVEGAESPATSGVVARDVAADRPVELLLLAQPSTPVQLPPRITIPGGAGQTSFHINVLDDPQVNGARTINLIARIIADDGRVLTEGATTNVITVLDNDGPTVTLTTEREVVNEGGTLNASVARNTETSQPLVVQLSVDDSTEVSVPASVEIPAGESSTSFVVTGLEDGVTDGVQAAFVEATATGFNAGSIKVNVADGDLPDLAVSHIVVPATGGTDARAEVTWRVTNNGRAPAEGSWTDRVYISRDNQLGGDLLAVSVPATGPLGVDEHYVRNQQITLPSQPGLYHIIVITDTDDEILEGSERNNLVSVATIDVAPAYRAFVETDVEYAPSGTTIPLSGRAYYTEDNSPALYKLVTVRLRVNNTRREVQVIADGEGRFTHDFQPLPTEAGVYSIGADHPLVEEDETQDQFRLLGMRAEPKSLRWRLIPDDPHSGSIEILNASDQPLTGLTAAFVEPPEGFDFQLSVPSELPGDGAINLNYTATTTITNQAHHQLTLEVRSAEGAVTRVPTTIDVSPLRPVLVANPPFLERGMLRGAQSIVSFEVSNVGGAPSGDLAVLLPDEPWMQLASTTNIASLAPGQTSTVTLTLNPAEDLPLLRYDGQLALAGGRYGLNMPFQFRAVSDALGDVRVRVTDEFTYFTEGAPQVADATVRLRDPITGADVAEGVTDESGEVLLTGVPEGAYTLEAFAPKHTTHRSTITVVPGIETEAEAFISRQTVTYTWSVVPIEIEDRYRIVLESVFETEVPIPNVIIEEPYIMPLVVEGEITQFEMTLRNEGLIAAENVKVLVPDDPRYLIKPLVEEIGTIPAKSRLVIPVTIQLRNDPFLQTASSGPVYEPKPHLHNGETCEVGVHDCLPKIPLGVTYTYTCGANNVTQARRMDLTPICAGKSIYECIKKLVNVDEVRKAKKNLAAAACEIIDAILSCTGAELTNCEKAAIQIACRTIVGAATGGAGGAAAGAGSGLFDSIGCLCDLIKNYAGTVSGSSGGGGGGGGGGTVNWGAYAGGFGGTGHGTTTDCSGTGGFPAPGTGHQRLMGNASSAGVCARVRIRIEQEAVMTRAAFLGTLEIENDGALDLTGVQLTLDFRDEQGNPAEDMFAWREPKLTGISDVDGGGVVPANGSSSVQYTFIPTREAAEFEPTVYRIGGTLRYVEDGVEVVVPMLSSTITVYPEARLKLNYFQSRNVYSDDPFTDEVEPAEPFHLGLIAQNLGAGAARNFRITSAQPEIIENDKGLLIDFKIIGTQVGDESLDPSLTADLGTIEPGGSQVAQWIFLSSLQGKFIEYSATFEHLDSLGSANLSLIDSVEIHELIHPVRADRPGDDTLPDFLVNDVPDPDDFADTLYLSDGTVELVEPAGNGVADGTASLSRLSVNITADMPGGWGYLVMNDPGPDLELWKVVDSNGRELLVGDNVWTTDRSFPSALAGAVRENKLHLLDFDGTGDYTLFYRPSESIPPEIVTLAGPVPALQNAAVDFIDVEFSEPLNLDTFRPEDVFLALNGGDNRIDGNVTVTETGFGQYRIGGLTALTGDDGNYQLAVDAAGIEDLAGNAGLDIATTSWAKGSTAPVIVSLGPVSPNPRNTPVSEIDVEFSRAMDSATFDLNALSLTRDGGDNLIDNGVTLTPLDESRFRIGGLNGLTLAGGFYELTVSAAATEDELGVAGAGQLSATWSTVTTGPAFAGIERLATNPRNIVVLSLDVYFQAPIEPDTFDYRDVRITLDGGPDLVTSEVEVTQVDATTYRISNFNWVVGQQGEYTLTVDAAGIQDAAGNVGTGTVSETWQMITTRPLPPQNLALVPDPGTSDTDQRINSLGPNLTGTTDRTGLTLRVRDMTLDEDLGAFPVTGTDFSAPLNFAQQGLHRLRVNLVDDAANVSTDVFLDVFIDTTAPTATIDPVLPTPRDTPVGHVTLRFSEAMNHHSFALADAVLSRDDGDNLIAAPIAWTAVSTNVFTLGDLSDVTETPGNYTLTVDLAGLEDEAGNSGSGAVTANWQRNGDNTRPVIAAIPNLVGEVGVTLLHTNSAVDTDIPANVLTWSLDPGAPGNANISAHGVFSWRPTRAQAPGDYPITVRVTDNGVPALSDTRTFTVSVGDYSEIVVGTTIVESGSTGTLPLTLLSSAGVTNISMTLSLPSDRFTNLRVVDPLAQSARSSVTPLGSDQHRVTFDINEGLTIVGSNRLGLLEFDAAVGQQSSFVPVTLDEFTAPKADGTLAPNILTADGRIIVVDQEPLLESVRTNGRPRIFLYGRAGDAFEVDVTDQLGGEWTPFGRVPMTSNRHALEPDDESDAVSQFFRARVFAPDPPVMEVMSTTDGRVRVVGYGEPGPEYLIEVNETAAPTGWVPVIDGPLTNSFWLQEVDPDTGTSRVWRFQRK